MKRVTIKDVAKVAGVSYTTVSRALAGSPDIGESTRARIARIAGEMGYSANVIARSLVAKETKTIGLIVSNIRSAFTSEIAYYIEEMAWSHGYTTMLCNSGAIPEKEEEIYKLLVAKQLDGIIMMPSHAYVYDRILPYMNVAPTVFINENLQDKSEDYVTVDDYKGAFMGTEYLYSIGHRKIVYLGRRSTKVSRQLRMQGYIDACETYGLAPRYIDYRVMESSAQNGYILAKELFAQDRDYTAVFACTDSLAMGVIQAADELNISIPEELSLLGFDNIAFSNLPKIKLTTIEQPKQAMAAEAVTMLMEKIQYPAMTHMHKSIAPSLIIRESCRHI